MAHFAQIDENNIVTQVIVISNDDCNGGNFPDSESYGVDFLERLFGHRNWKQTSYNGSFRGRFAGAGFEYNSAEDCFKEIISESTLLDIAEEQVKHYATGTTQN